ncbi:MAG: isocitrate/isopropylmalate dehydrogenase family protein [Chloroflexota bacterium]
MTMTTPIKLLLLEGDGIGPEIVTATRRVLEAVDTKYNLNLQFTTTPIGFAALEAYGTTLPDVVDEFTQAADATILGPISHNDYPPAAQGGLNPSGELRKRLNLYANIRPARSLPGIPPRCGKPLDLVIVRENTEGFYADRSMYMGPGEFMPTPDLALSVRKVTRQASMRIAESAFEMAMQRRKQVTAVHKGNVLRVSDGLFLECVREVASRYPDVVYEEKLVDAMAALLVRDASVFDVIVTTNMFGDILSDLAAEIAGSLGLAASINTSDTYAIAQAQHGSAPDIAGQDIANPSSLIGSAAMLLRWLAERRDEPTLSMAAGLIDETLTQLLSSPETRTADLGGVLGTVAFTDALIASL